MAGTEGAAAAQAIANAVKASGVIVRMDANDFLNLLRRMEAPLVVYAEGGVFSTKYRYLTSYKGLAFYTKVKEPLDLPMKAEVVVAQKIWVPDGV